MPNITQVNLTSGVPSGPAGPATVSTLDNLIGIAGTPVANVQTIQGIAGATAVAVSGAVTASGTVTANQGGTWNVGITGTATVSGIVAATQSGAWDVRNITGTVSLPTGAATAAKQPALGTAGTPSADIITVQGVTAMTPLKVDGSAVTQPVSGSVSVTNASIPVTQSGAWSVGVTGTVPVSQSGNWTNRIVGNTGATIDFSAAQNIAPPTNCLLVAGEFNTIPTTITTGNASPLQLDNAANLLVNVKTGAVSATQSGNWNVRVQDGSGTAITSTGGALDINIKSGGGSGGTSSNFGTTFPTAGTAAGAEYLSAAPTLTSGQMVALQTDVNGNLKVNIQAGAGSGGTAMADSAAFTFATTQGTPAFGVFQTTATNNALTNGQAGAWQMTANRAGFVNLRNAAGTELATSGAPLRVDPTGTTTQPISGTVTVTQGTAANLNATVSGTVTANQGGAPWTVTSSSATAPVSTMNSASAATGQNAAISACFDDVSPTTITENNFGYLRMSTNRNLYGTIRDAAGNERGANVTAANALVVDGSGVTQPISGTVTVTQATAANLNATVTGTVAATQSGTWNINNISGTVSLPTGAATSANQPTAAAIGSTTSGQTGNLAMGAVTTAAPSYTTATTNNLSLTTAGALRVDGSGATQPVSGTVTANQGGTWNITNVSGTVSLPTGASTSANQPSNAGQGSTTSGQTGTLAMGAVTTGNPTYVTAQTSPLSLDTSGALRVNVIAGSGGGGTSSSFGSSFPATGTAIGVKDSAGTNMTFLQVNASNALKVDGSAVTQPVSGTVTVGNATLAVTQSGNWTTRVVGNTGAVLDFAGQNAASPANALLAGAQYNSTPTTITSGNSSPLQLDSAGNLKVNTIDPSVFNAGTAWTSATGLNTAANLYTNLSPAFSTIVGQITQTTTITAGAVTFEESYDGGTTWKSIPVTRMIDPATTLVLANPYTFVASTNQAFQIATVGNAQIRARLSTVITGTGSVTIAWTLGTNDDLVSVVQEGAPWVVQGDVANGSTDGNNPVKIGGLAKTANPTAVSDGQRVAATFDKQGKQVVVGALRQLKGVQQTSITSASETTIVTAGSSGVFQDLYGLVLANRSATGVYVTIKDATAGTTRSVIYCPANDTRGFMLPVDSAIPQASAANNWTATVSSAVTAIEVTALFVSNL